MEQEIIDKIIEVIQLKLGWSASWSPFEQDGRFSIDGKLSTKTEDGDLDLACEVQKSVVPSTIPRISGMLAAIENPSLPVDGTMLLASYISTNARELLQERKINYADTAGNIFLQCKGWYIHIETGQSNRAALSNNAGRAFTKTGLKVVHQLFRTNQKLEQLDKLYPDLTDKSYQDLADEAKVSKDTVSKVMLDLLDKGYIIRQSKTKFKWRAKKELFERWVQEYNQTLKPSLEMKRFKFIEKPDVKFLSAKGYQISGYHAVDLHYNIPIEISKQIISPIHILYSHKPLRNTIQDFKLIPSKEGNVFVYEAFWKDENHIAVDHIISYADLIGTNDPRILEVAQIIYQSYFNDKL